MTPLKPMGPQAMLDRIRQLQGQCVSDTSTESARFQVAVKSGLEGAISTEGSLKPWSPFGPGTSVESSLTPAQLRPALERAAKEHALDPDLLDALVQTESAYNPLARSDKNAAGLTQLMPDTARELGVTDPFDPVQSLKGGARYLSSMIKRFDGDLEKAVAAYNAGPGAVQKFGGIPPYKETRDYVERVMSLYRAKRPQ